MKFVVAFNLVSNEHIYLYRGMLKTLCVNKISDFYAACVISPAFVTSLLVKVYNQNVKVFDDTLNCKLA